jgi:hypothetical protein
MSGRCSTSFDGRDLGVEQRLLLQHLHLADAAELETLLHQAQRLVVGADDVVGDVDLRLQRRLVDRGGDDVGGQRQDGGFHLVALILGLGVQLLDLPPDAAERVQCIGDVHRAGDQPEGRGAAAQAERGERGLLPLRLHAGAELREQGALPGPDVLQRLPQGGLGGGDGGIAGQRLPHQSGDLR